MKRIATYFVVLIILSGGGALLATETEHLDFQVVPAPGEVKIDGEYDDWDISASILACGDVENSREKFSVWLAAMWDKDYIYVLARWNDHTPMNHPGSSKGDYGFNGDCLQIRFMTAPDIFAKEIVNIDRNAKDAEKMRTSHWDCWRDRDGIETIGGCYGRHFNEGGPGDAKAQGAAQAFKKNADGKGYVQEIRLPWRLLCKEGVTPAPGWKFLMTFEPNFTIGRAGRLTIKDCFRAGVGIDRVFTFSNSRCWGVAALLDKGNLTPRPVRLADGREFAVRLENSAPVVDWTGLVKSRLPDGFKTLKFSIPEDGYVSLNIFRPDGTVARHLLATAFFAKGEYEVKWDGLSTMSVRQPGQPLPPGEYTWSGIWHTGVGLRLRGVACTAGSSLGDWGGDHGEPVACASDGERIYLGWGGAEGGKALVAVDPAGNVKWRNLRGGIGSASLVAVDSGTVYALNLIGQYAPVAIYRVSSTEGRYTEWESVKSTDLLCAKIWEELGLNKDQPKNPSAMAAAEGRVMLTYGDFGVVALDGKTGAVLKKHPLPQAGAAAAAGHGKVYVAHAKDGVNLISRLDIESGALENFVARPKGDKGWVSCLAVDAQGAVYAGIRDGDMHIEVYDASGKLRRTIGRKGGRPLLGPWQPDGVLNPSSLAIDKHGQLWVAENDGWPRRFSVWDAKTGAFKAEYFGAASYGATGGAIDPIDPYRMVGQGCEWRIDPHTGRAACLGVITRDGMAASRYGLGPDGKRIYLAVTPGFLHGAHPVRIFERLGDGMWRLRTVLRPREVKAEDGKPRGLSAEVWADVNDDSQEQPDEVRSYDVILGGWFQGWYMSMSQDLTFWGSLYRVAVTGWTPCGAPQYDLSQARKLPAPENPEHRGGMGAMRGHGSADGKYMLYNGPYGVDHGTVDCFEIEGNRLLWTYPSNFTGVHGSHRACGPEPGMIRGAYDIVGSAKLPEPVGNIWVIPTNKGEWHILTERGFYLTKIFEGDPMKNQWPERAVPGAIMDACPPGAGEEAFGGSLTQTIDGKLQVQAGHTGFWNCEVVGLETVKPLPQSGRIVLTEEDAKTAVSWRAKLLQEAAGIKKLAVKKASPVFTGDLAKDFGNAAVIKFQRMDAAWVRAAMAWDERNLYIGWLVKDDTPWVNGADAPEYMYARGDTVDLQLGTDPAADKKRTEAGRGDLRLTIGPFQGKAMAVIYRKVAEEKDKAPKSFSSGVVKNYVMDSVKLLPNAKIEVKIDAVNRLYAVEAAIPLSDLGLQIKPGLVISGDVGATHGNKMGNDTALRTYWSNLNTGLVSDEVFELQMAPQNWGEIAFVE